MRIRWLTGLLAVLVPLASGIGTAPAKGEVVWPPDGNVFYQQSMTFTVGRHSLLGECAVDGRTVKTFDIYAVGNFDSGAADRLRAFLRQNPPQAHCTTIWFHSQGGNLGQGLKMGEVIREHKLRTSIGIHISGSTELVRRSNERGICFSACSFAFLGGVARSPDSGYYGVHRFYQREPEDLVKDKAKPRSWITDNTHIEGTQLTMVNLMNYVISMGASPELLDEMVKAAGVIRQRGEKSENFLSRETMARLRVTTPYAAAEWEIVNDRGAAAVRATLPQRDAKHALMLTCETPAGGAPRRLTMTLFLQTASPAIFLAAKEIKIWRRAVDGPRMQGTIIAEEHDVVPDIYAPAQPSQRLLTAGRAGIVATLQVARLPFDLRRQTEIFFGFGGRHEGFQVEMTGGHAKIAELLDTCR